MLTRRALTLAPLVFTLPAMAQSASIMEIMKPHPLGDKILGDEKAPVTIVEYASATCSHCAHFHTTTYPELKKRYIDTGKVRLIFREFSLNSLAAATFMIARCAPGDAYFPIVDVFMRTQSTWLGAPNKEAALFNIAQQAGFTKETFEACLKNQTILDGVNASQTQGEKLGVDATPTFFINGTKFSGSMSIEEMAKVIDPLIK